MADDERNDSDKPGLGMKLVAVGGLILSSVFLANVPALPPEIPDLLPLVGNLDELLASAVFLWSARTLGLKPIDFLRGRKERKQLAAGKRELSERRD